MNFRRGDIVLVLTFCAVAILHARPAFAQQFATFDPPGSIATFPSAINDMGEIDGLYLDQNFVGHGFSLQSGVFSTIDVPQAIYTNPLGLNNLGQIVGGYTDANNVSHGFLLSGGVFTTIDDPAFPQNSLAQISDLGTIVGVGLDSQGNSHGFTLNNGVFTTIDFPGATSTQPGGMSANGAEIVGWYQLPTFPEGTYEGFSYIGGVFSTISFPGSASTLPDGVNKNGEVTGLYILPEQTAYNGFLQIGSTFITENVPSALSTAPANLNDLGEVVGNYADASNINHGYVMTSGPFAYAPVRAANSVAVFDITSQLQLPSIPVGSGPVGIALSPSGTSGFVANYQGNTVSAINTANNTVVATIPVGSSPLGVAVTPDGFSAYVANNFSNNVSVINTTSNTVIATVPVGSIPSFVAVTPNGNFVYVTNQGSNSVSVISTATNTVVANVSIGAGQVGLAATPDGKFVYVTVPATNSVAVISTASNTVVNTIPVGPAPVRVSITPDGTSAYVSNQNSDFVTVINVPSSTVINNVTVGTTPYGSAPTPDGSAEWVIDAGSSQLSVISTATNTASATLSFSGGSDIAIAPAPPTSQSVTQPLSPTQPNTFTFATTNYVVQYPTGTSFSGVNMTTSAVEMTQAQFAARVAGTQFSNATCIVDGGTGGNCVDYQISCSDNSGNQITCPTASTPSIAVQTSFSTSQSVINPGFLTTPNGLNEWTNIFTGYSDPTVKGKTSGFGPARFGAGNHGEEFVAVSLGSSNPQGQAKMQVVSPKFPATYNSGGMIPVVIRLTSVATGQPITNGHASISVVMVLDGNGNATNRTMLSKINAFVHASIIGEYKYTLDTTKYPAGTYTVTLWGDSFPAAQGKMVFLK